jgi:hypothetical protein
MEWVTDRKPKKPCQCLVTLYGDSVMENYVTYAGWSCKPYHGFDGFRDNNGNDITDEVIAWMKFPEPYQSED